MAKAADGDGRVRWLLFAWFGMICIGLWAGQGPFAANPRFALARRMSWRGLLGRTLKMGYGGSVMADLVLAFACERITITS